jgi:hypothetical protein
MAAAPPATASALRPCDGWPGYSVDAAGAVWSHWRRERAPGRAGFRVFPGEAPLRTLARELDGWGYARVRLRRDGRRQWARVNVLVCAAFRGPCPGYGVQARHLDGDKRNNAESNLAWGTALENSADKRLHGTILAGADCPHAVFDEDAALAVLEEYHLHGFSIEIIAALRGVSAHTVRNLVTGRTYRDLQPVPVGRTTAP